MSAINTYGVCDLDLIYNEDFQYSLPKEILEGFLSGNAFDYKKDYTLEESKNLSEDINTLYQDIISKNPVKEKIAIITAGAPGAGKTFKLKQDLEANALQGKHYAYICPDDVCLKNQNKTYKAESTLTPKEAYRKWRPGSNAATHIILGNLIRERYAFYFGSTSSSPATGKFFEFLKAQGYCIKLLHVSASDKVRWNSIQERDKTFVQTEEEDIIKKGLSIPERIQDTFLTYADEIEFYFRDGVQEDAILAAKWLRNQEKEYSGTLQIISPDSYEKIKAIHNEAAKVLNKSKLDWKLTVEDSSQIL